jgi:excisionase family DNA binding protein
VEDKIYTRQEVAKLLQVHPDTVQEWIEEGKLASIKIGHKTVRILQSDIDNFIRDRRREASFVKRPNFGEKAEHLS